MKHKTKITFLGVLLVSLSPTIHAEDKSDKLGWVSLFNGRNLEGWKQLNGTGTYEVKDGAIVGTTAEGSPNSFLCTVKKYSNFELEFEVKVDKSLNSGVQIRSLQVVKGMKPISPKPKHNEPGRVYGPQVEIEAGPGQAGFIFGEAMGGWLSKEPQSDDAKVNTHNHFRNDDWNKFRVIAKGSSIETFVNGHKVASLDCEKSHQTNKSGFIGLQVHSIKKGKGPFSVSWKNLKIKVLE